MRRSNGKDGLSRRRVPSSVLGPGLALAFAAGLLLAAPAGAQDDGLDSESRQPIEITADNLEVHRDQSLAIFRGNVVAVQGELRLRAQVLKVHYREDEGGPEGAAISRIDVEGDVFVSSPTETAEGEWGVYDVEARMIYLNGSVVLTQGDNVIRGDRLVLNLETGMSRIESGDDADGGERVHGIFVAPEEEARE